MFKIGDRVRVKDDVVDIIRAMDKDGISTVETETMIATYAGRSSVVEWISDDGYYRVFGWFWGEYSLEHDYVNSINGYTLFV